MKSFVKAGIASAVIFASVPTARAWEPTKPVEIVVAAGAVVVGQLTQQLDRPNPATYLGKGKIDELARASEQSTANTSQHLQALHAAGMVTREREGTRVRYALAGEDVLGLWLDLRGASANRLAEVERAAREYLHPERRVRARLVGGKIDLSPKLRHRCGVARGWHQAARCLSSAGPA